MRRSAGLLSALVLLGGACGDNRERRPDELRVLTFNLRHDEDDWEKRFPLIADEVVRLDPDVIGLQEVHLFSEQTRRLQDLIAERTGDPDPAYHVYEVAKGSIYAANGEGLAILSRWEISFSRFVELEYGRRTLHAVIDAPGGLEIAFFNTHLHHEGGDEVRLPQAQITTDFIEQFADERPIVLTGDMNATDDSQTIGHLVSSGLVDTFRDLHGDATAQIGNTSPIVLEEGAFDQTPTRRIDYVLADPSLPVLDSVVGFENHDSDGLYPSDHLGVMTTLGVP